MNEEHKAEQRAGEGVWRCVAAPKAKGFFRLRLRHRQGCRGRDSGRIRLWEKESGTVPVYPRKLSLLFLDLDATNLFFFLKLDLRTKRPFTAALLS